MLKCVMGKTAALVVLLAVLCGCAGDDGETVAASGDPTAGQDPTVTTAVERASPSTEPGAAPSTRGFVEHLAAAPAYSAADFSLPFSPEDMLERSRGALRGTIVSVGAASTEEFELSAPNGDGSEVRFSMRRLGIVVEIAVDHTIGPPSDVSAGSTVVVTIPVYDGPLEFLEDAAAQYLDPVVAAAPIGAQTLLTIGAATVGDPTQVELAGIGTMLIEDATGISSIVVEGDGQIWGARTLDAVEQQMAAP